MAYLAKALRRVLGPAIDLLWEQGEHPYQTVLNGNGSVGTRPSLTEGSFSQTAPFQHASAEGVMREDLDLLGIGIGLSETLESVERH